MKLSSIAKKLGSKGGKTRAKNLAPESLRKIASLGGKARAQSLHTKKLILENFRYLEAMNELHPPPKVTRLTSSRKHLPGLHG